MIDLPDFGYVSMKVQLIDPGGSVPGSLGGPSDYISRPGARFSVSYQLPELSSSDDARKFQVLLEQGGQDDVSYPWPLDFRPAATGSSSYSGASPFPAVNGSNPPGSAVNIKNVIAGYPFKQGQPVALVKASTGVGCIHRVVTPVVADNLGHVTLTVFPYTRMTFVDGDRVGVERPRIRGILQWDGAGQGAYGRRGFSFSITERL